MSVLHTQFRCRWSSSTPCALFLHPPFIQMQCLRCKCRIAIVFPPEGVPSLDMLLDTGISEQSAAGGADEESDCDDDAHDDEVLGGGQAAEELDEADDTEQDQEVDETEECGDDDDDSSSGGESDADNGMGRKTGAARVMVESFADRCVQRRLASVLAFSTHTLTLASANLAGLAGVPDAAEVLQSVFVAIFSTT